MNATIILDAAALLVWGCDLSFDLGRSMTIRFVMDRATLMETRRLAREEVRQHWKEQGRRAYDYSFKELVTADEYLRLRPELIEQACANLETDAQQSKPSNQRGIFVKKSWSKWRLG